MHVFSFNLCYTSNFHTSAPAVSPSGSPTTKRKYFSGNIFGSRSLRCTPQPSRRGSVYVFKY